MNDLLKCPEWRAAQQAAMMEVDESKLLERANEAEAATAGVGEFRFLRPRAYRFT